MRLVLTGLVASLLLAATLGTARAATGWAGRITVKPGASLSEIAKQYGISFEALATANGLDWRKPLLAGAVLRVPSSQESSGDWSGRYVVQAGDTLSGIALRFHISLGQLDAVNGIDPAAPLWVGVKLRVPAAPAVMPDLAAIEETDAYQHGATGYDISYPNCRVQAPGASAFALIGLNGGRPFTRNPCFAGEWASAQAPRSVYVNSAYSPAMLAQVRPGCRTVGRDQPLPPDAQSAFAIGCGEAAAALRMLGAMSSTPVGIWVDVERANSWSRHRSLNIATIEGMLDEILTSRPAAIVGVYSTLDSWSRIVGDWHSLSVPEWIGAVPASSACPSGFAEGPVWLSQNIGAATIDLDTGC